VLSREAWSRALALIGVTRPTVLEELLTRHAQAVARNLRLVDAASEVLDAAAATGAKLAVITNGPLDAQTDKLRALAILDRFDVVTTSGGAGIMKPDPQIFRLTLDSLGVPVDRAIHIGDNLVSDVGGAKAAGLATVWFNEHGKSVQPGAPAPDYVVMSLREVRPILA
jgi:HAD superfamily hydrolase (TIGR01549 family)